MEETVLVNLLQEKHGEIRRTENTIRNVVWGFANKIVMLVFPFIIRTIIIQYLGADYVGLSSLFSSILSVLSLAELGFGSAIIYCMYDPIANHDNERICALLSLYRKLYRLIGAIILVVGLSLIPLFQYIIKSDIPAGMNIYILYCIYLANTVLTYWLFAYKSSLLFAFQRNDVVSNISTVLHILMYIVQIAVLSIFRNYYVYVICIPFFSALINSTTAIASSRLFPDLKCMGNPSFTQISIVKKQAVGLLIQRLAFSSRNSFDSIIISMYLGLVAVGIYNNYMYVLNAVTTILAILFASMQAGLGNSIARESAEKNYNDFISISFLYMWISGICTIAILVLAQPFMEIWVGEELMYNLATVVLLSFYFLSMKTSDTVGAYVGATGLWWNCRFAYIAEAGVNLVLNLLLGKYLGIKGIIIASFISVVFVNVPFSIYVLYKYYFKEFKAIRFIMDNCLCWIATIINAALCWIILDIIPYIRSANHISIIALCARGILCFIISNVIYFAMLFRVKSFRDSILWLKPKLRRIKLGKIV